MKRSLWSLLSSSITTGDSVIQKNLFMRHIKLDAFRIRLSFSLSIVTQRRFTVVSKTAAVCRGIHPVVFIGAGIRRRGDPSEYTLSAFISSMVWPYRISRRAVHTSVRSYIAHPAAASRSVVLARVSNEGYACERYVASARSGKHAPPETQPERGRVRGAVEHAIFAL